MSGDNSEEKTEQASHRKLRKQREQGTLPRTSDAMSMLNIIVGLLVLIVSVGSIFNEFTVLFDVIFNSWSLPLQNLKELGLHALITAIFKITVTIVLATIFAMLLTTTLYQGGLPFSFQPLLPNFERLSPASGLQRMFGRRSFIEVIFHFVRVSLWISVAGVVVWTIWPWLFQLDLCTSNCALNVFETLLWRLVILAIFALLVFFGFEMKVQKSLYMHEQKMSKSDVKREQKEQTGSPELRGERQRIRKEIAKEAEFADKSLANMCYYFADKVVALRYHPSDTPIPRVNAKAEGVDGVHLRRYLAEKGVPSLADQKVTEACYKVAPGAAISKGAFKDVARAMSKLFGTKP